MNSSSTILANESANLDAASGGPPEEEPLLLTKFKEEPESIVAIDETSAAEKILVNDKKSHAYGNSGSKKSLEVIIRFRLQILYQ